MKQEKEIIYRLAILTSEKNWIVRKNMIERLVGCILNRILKGNCKLSSI